MYRFERTSMNSISLTDIERRWFLARHEPICPYFKDRPASLLFLRGDNVGQLYRQLLDEGYRRSGEHLYRPDCPGCRECQVYRVAIDGFEMRKSQRRIFRNGQKRFQHRLVRPSLTSEKMDLYRKYLAGQHGDPEQALMLDDFSYMEFFVRSFLGDRTREIQLYDGDRLMGVGICDLIMDVWSSVYFYFDPDYSADSPGHYSMLLEIDLARQMGYEYYYPGFLIHGIPAMEYKNKLRPGQIRTIGTEDFTEYSPPVSGIETREY